MNILLIDHYAGTPAYGMEYRPYHLGKEMGLKDSEIKKILG